MDGLKYYVIFSVLCYLSTQVSGKGMECTGSWQSIHRACYKFNKDDKKTWQEALDACNLEGGSLISIGSTVEYRKVVKAIQKIISTDEMLTWWVGLKRNKANGKFSAWLDNITFSRRVTKWAPGEPNNRGNKEDCVEIKFDGKLNDKNCLNKNPYVCELNEITQRPTHLTTAQVNTQATTTKGTTMLTTTTATTTTATTTTMTKPTTKAAIINTPIEEVERTTRARSDIDPAATTTMKPNVETFQEDLTKYRICYDYRAIVREIKARENKLGANFVELGTSCRAIQAAGIQWPESPRGQPVLAQCAKGSGSATFVCGQDPVCWRSQPDVSDCASKKFKNLLEKTKAIFQQNRPPPVQEGGVPETKPQVVEVSVNETLEVTDTLAAVTSGEDISVADVMLTSQVIKSLTNTKFKKGPRSKKAVQNIVKNVVKAGSNLVSKNKSATWSEMKAEDRVLSATTLLVAMESATVTMAESLNEPVVIESKDENIDMELHVLNVSDSLDNKPLVYGEKDAENTFSIPKETLKKLSKGGLAKAVFMTHYQISDILQEKHTPEDTTDDTTILVEPEIVSYVISASLVGAEHVKLPEPISFTLKHKQTFLQNAVPLCSFLNLSEGVVGIWSQEGCILVRTDDSSTTCQCDHLTNFAILMDVQGVEMSVVHSSLLRYITLVGCIISIICLFLCFLTFNCFSLIQGERNSIHKNLVFCLFVAEILFLAGIDKTENKITCGLIAGFLHYFFLTAFTWMFLEGLHIICMLVQVFDAAKSRLPYYYFAGYGFPLAVVAVSAGVYHQGYGTDRYCWLTTENYFIWSFAGPVAVVLLVNSVVLIYAMSTVCRHADYVFSGGKDKTGSDMRAWIQGAIAIEVILGLTWIFGYCFISQETIALAYIFTILNSLQGLFIFCFHCLLNKKVIKEYKRIFHITKRPASSTQTASLMRKHGASYEMSHPSQTMSQSHSEGSKA